MARVKRTVNAQEGCHSILEETSGYYNQRSRLCRKARGRVTHSGVHAFRDRRARKGDFRRLWIQCIDAVARAEGLVYGRFTQGFGLTDMEIDRRILAKLAANEPAGFKVLIGMTRRVLPEDVNAPKA